MKVLSFDIFDTLLLRPYIDPQEIWTLLEERENLKGFAALRKHVDEITYADAIAHNTETTLDAAYRLLPIEWDYMKQKEMEFERKVLVSNPEMKKVWDQAKQEGYRRVIVSDMYMPLSFIKDVLEENGFGDWDALYLSSDRKVRKSSGLLFQIMMQELHVAPIEVIHLGDNPISDVIIPNSLGINTKFYKKISERFFELFPFAQYVDERLSGALALGWHLLECQTQDKTGSIPTYWNRLGFVMGGVLGYLYVSWIVKNCKERNISRLLFIARDGWILQRICNELYPEINTGYIYAPRMTSISVLGAIGSDPSAVKERQKYCNSVLKSVDKDEVTKEYTSYIEQFHIDNHTAIVDGCSSGFSAQRLVEKCLNKKVFCFYLLSMSKHQHAAALYSTQLYSLPFQSLSEFIFGSPEKPIMGINKGKPIYVTEIPDAELFKIGVNPELAEGAIAAAKSLHDYEVEITPRMWSDYSNTFMLHLSSEDKEKLSKAQNATDIMQKKFNSVIWQPAEKKKLIKFLRCGPRSFKVIVSIFGRTMEVHFSRHGIHFKIYKCH